MPEGYSYKVFVADAWDEDSLGYEKGTKFLYVYYLDRCIGDCRTPDQALELAMQHSKLKR